MRFVLRWMMRAACAAALAISAGCGVKTPLQPLNRSPVLRSVTSFPAMLSPGDSAVIVCEATDPDGDRLWYEWRSDCRLLIPDGYVVTRNNVMIVRAGTCTTAPLDTGWVFVTAFDDRGGDAGGRYVLIPIRR